MKAITPKVLLKDLRELIEAARQDVARQVNSALVLLYWRMGKRIRQDVLKEKRAEYGDQIVHAVSAQFAKEFGMGFSARNLRRMIQFVEATLDKEIVVTVSRQLDYYFNNLPRMRTSTSLTRSKILSLVKKAVAS